MIKKEMEIWGRSLNIEIVFDCYTGEEILEYQKIAYETFLNNSDELLNTVENDVKEYCKHTNPQDIAESEIQNIFKYVKPKTLYLPRIDNGKRTVVLLCAYRFNPDDGLAIVFENESLGKIGTGNII